ncbi:acetate uptake transporter [Nakamurella sp. PAMC28650]|uniref:acetate uptake transporter n=1 Tax=Nakamurella sp. PAMC28650 TaxID=2762325 RepID=UPI001C9A482C|nr:acetate uptake transporter [Nakamurella sp. PAMC28650]
MAMRTASAGPTAASPATAPSSAPTTPASVIAPETATIASRVADPGPLGLAAFAMTTFFLSVVNAGLVPASVTSGMLALAFFYGGVAQILAGMWEFIKGNTFGAVAFTSYGAFWMAVWYLIDRGVLAGMGADEGKGFGLFLLGWTIFTVYMFICSTRTSGVLIAVFGALALTFLFLTIGAFGASSGMTKVGGWLGLLTALLGWYGSMAGVMNATAKRVVLPTFPRA